MTTTMNQPPESLLRALREGNRFLITAHLSPDGDAIGSELGLARVLRKLGKGAVIWNHDATPEVYRPLPGSERIHAGEAPPPGFPEGFDAVVALECPTIDRSGLEAHLGALQVLNIDHHLGNQHYAAVNWVDTAAPSLGEMIHRLAGKLMVSLDEETATCLFLTLVTDTGGFRFANATVEAFEAAAELVREGAHPERVAQWLYESRPPQSLRLLAEMLATLELHHDGRIATVRITQEMFARSGATVADTEGLIDHPRSIRGVEAVALLRETGDGRTKVSLRSRGDVSVQEVALRYGGGGHKNASGFTADGPLDELLPVMVEALDEALAKTAGH